MKKQLIISAAISAILALTITAPSAYATIINDDYWGGNNHGWGDVIGKKAWFDIQSMDVELTGNSLSVTINTNFAGRADDGLFDGTNQANLTKGLGIGYGDLFLSNSWNPAGDAPYANDNYSNGTVWSYAFSLDDRWTNGGNGSLYSLVGDDSDTLLSENFLTGGTFRNGQEIAVDTNGKTAISSSSWSVIADTYDTVGKISFLIDLTGTSLAGSNTIALHWGMTCGNDTIEGEYSSVPEPATLGLLALGLIGVGASQRKRN